MHYSHKNNTNNRNRTHDNIEHDVRPHERLQPRLDAVVWEDDRVRCGDVGRARREYDEGG